MSGFGIWFNAAASESDVLETVDVSPGDSYESWPVILKAANGDLVVVYGDGDSHVNDVDRAVVVQTSSDDGATWSTQATISDDGTVDEAAFGGGTDSSGNLLAWVRSRTGAGTITGHRLIRSTDNGTTWADLADPSWSPTPTVVSDVIAVPTVGLMSFWADDSWAWGITISGDDGASWTQSTVQSGLAESACPVEAALAYVGGGKILGVARTQTGAAMFQLQSDDYGSTWTVGATNIAETLTRAALVLHDDLEIVDLYYYDRDDGNLEYRRTTIADIWDDPTGWPDPETLATESGTGGDAGYAHAVRTSDGINVVAYYTGTSSITQVKALRHETAGSLHPSLDAHERLGLATKSELPEPANETVFAPAYTVTDGTALDLSVTFVWGIDGDGDPYYNAAGVTAGDEAVLVLDNTTGNFSLRPVEV